MSPSAKRGVGRRTTRKSAKSANPASLKPQEQLQGQAPHHQFREQHQGTLPEQLTEINLVALNSALGFLFTHLREARWKFEHEKDNGRFAAFIALGAFWQFVVLFDRPFAEGL